MGDMCFLGTVHQKVVEKELWEIQSKNEPKNIGGSYIGGSYIGGSYIGGKVTWGSYIVHTSRESPSVNHTENALGTVGLVPWEYRMTLA